jgi:membrane-associated phospholipid phosphatase
MSRKQIVFAGLAVAGVAAWLRKPWRDIGRLLLFHQPGPHGITPPRGHAEKRLQAAAPLRGHRERRLAFLLRRRWNSFPSTHSAHFWSLFFPLALAFPRYRLWFSIVPLFISVARVGVNDHFVSDVLAGAAVAAFMTWALSGLAKISAAGTGYRYDSRETGRL